MTDTSSSDPTPAAADDGVDDDRADEDRAISDVGLPHPDDDAAAPVDSTSPDEAALDEVFPSEQG